MLPEEKTVLGWEWIKITSHKLRGNTIFGQSSSLNSFVKIECDCKYVSVKKMETNTRILQS